MSESGTAAGQAGPDTPGASPASRPAVSVVVPFAGSAAQAAAAIEMLQSLRTRPGDELILSDNSGTAAAAGEPGDSGGEMHRYGAFLPQSRLMRGAAR